MHSIQPCLCTDPARPSVRPPPDAHMLSHRHGRHSSTPAALASPQVETGGEDAYFIRRSGRGACGVADGVGSWVMDGVNPAEFPRCVRVSCWPVVRPQLHLPPAVSQHLDRRLGASYGFCRWMWICLRAGTRCSSCAVQCFTPDWARWQDMRLRAVAGKSAVCCHRNLTAAVTTEAS